MPAREHEETEPHSVALSNVLADRDAMRTIGRAFLATTFPPGVVDVLRFVLDSFWAIHKLSDKSGFEVYERYHEFLGDHQEVDDILLDLFGAPKSHITDASMMGEWQDGDFSRDGMTEWFYEHNPVDLESVAGLARAYHDYWQAELVVQEKLRNPGE